MSKAQSPRKPHPRPLPRREGSGMLGCLFSCQLVSCSLVSCQLYNNKVKSCIMFRFLWICKEKNNFIDILSLKICV